MVSEIDAPPEVVFECVKNLRNRLKWVSRATKRIELTASETLDQLHNSTINLAGMLQDVILRDCAVIDELDENNAIVHEVAYSCKPTPTPIPIPIPTLILSPTPTLLNPS